MSIDYHFEWNPDKAQSNITKHKVSFEQASTVFLDPLALSIPDEEQPDNNERWVTLGHSTDDKTLLVVHTYRDNTNNSVTIRIISARKATKHEQRQYEATT